MIHFKIVTFMFCAFHLNEKKLWLHYLLNSLNSFIYDFKKHLFTIDFVSGNVVVLGDVMLNQLGKPEELAL